MWKARVAPEHPEPTFCLSSPSSIPENYKKREKINHQLPVLLPLCRAAFLLVYTACSLLRERSVAGCSVVRGWGPRCLTRGLPSCVYLPAS